MYHLSSFHSVKNKEEISFALHSAARESHYEIQNKGVFPFCVEQSHEIVLDKEGVKELVTPLLGH